MCCCGVVVVWLLLLCCCCVVVVVIVVVVADDALRCVYVNSTRVLIVQRPGAESPGSNLEPSQL